MYLFRAEVQRSGGRASNSHELIKDMALSENYFPKFWMDFACWKSPGRKDA